MSIIDQAKKARIIRKGVSFLWLKYFEAMREVMGTEINPEISINPKMPYLFLMRTILLREAEKTLAPLRFARIERYLKRRFPKP